MKRVLVSTLAAVVLAATPGVALAGACTLDFVSRSLADFSHYNRPLQGAGIDWIPPNDVIVLPDTAMDPPKTYNIVLVPIGPGAAAADWHVYGNDINGMGQFYYQQHNGTGGQYSLVERFVDPGYPVWSGDPDPQIIGWMRLSSVVAVSKEDPQAGVCPAVSCRLFAAGYAPGDRRGYVPKPMKFSWKGEVAEFTFKTALAYRAAMLQPAWGNLYNGASRVLAYLAASVLPVVVDPLDYDYLSFSAYSKAPYVVANTTTAPGMTPEQMSAYNAWMDALATLAGHMTVIAASISKANGAYVVGDVAAAHAQVDHANVARQAAVADLAAEVAARPAVRSAFNRDTGDVEVNVTLSLQDAHAIVDPMWKVGAQAPALSTVSYDANVQILGSLSGSTIMGFFPGSAVDEASVAQTAAWRGALEVPFCYGDAPCGQSRELGVTKAGGDGTVVSTPPGVDCGSACYGQFDEGVVVSLTARSDSGSQFVGWSGACAGSGECLVVMSADQSVEALFAPMTPPPSDGGSIDPVPGGAPWRLLQLE